MVTRNREPLGTCFVRPASAEDAEVAVAVIRKSIIGSCSADHHNDGPTLGRWLANKTPEQFCRWLQSAENYMVVAVVDSEIGGVGSLRNTGDLDLCYVHPGRQRAGIGRSIVQSLEFRARDLGLREIRLRSTATARSFYERNGYVFIATEPGFGISQDYLYAKLLA